MLQLGYYVWQPSGLKKHHYGRIIILEFPVLHLFWHYLLNSLPFCTWKAVEVYFPQNSSRIISPLLLIISDHHQNKEVLCPVLVLSMMLNSGTSHCLKESKQESVDIPRLPHSHSLEKSIWLKAHMQPTSGVMDNILLSQWLHNSFFLMRSCGR